MKQAVTAVGSAVIASTSTALIMNKFKEVEKKRIDDQLNAQQEFIKRLDQQIEDTRNEIKEKLVTQENSISELENKNSSLELQITRLQQQDSSLNQAGTMVGNAASWFYDRYKVDINSSTGVRIHEKDNTCCIL